MGHCTPPPKEDTIQAFVEFDIKTDEYILTVPSHFIDMDIEAGDDSIMIAFPSSSFVESKHKALKRFLEKCRPITSK